MFKFLLVNLSKRAKSGPAKQNKQNPVQNRLGHLGSQRYEIRLNASLINLFGLKNGIRARETHKPCAPVAP
jgi:hypothetical protein